MKTQEEIYEDIKSRFFELTQKEIETGSVIDLYNLAVSEVLGYAHEVIENNKNPHIYTNMTSQDMNDFGFFVNVPREPNESDEQYIFRIMNWRLIREASNKTAIENALLNLDFSSNAEFIPMSNGCGTGTIRIIPINFEEETIQNAIEEIKEKITNVASESIYIEYVVPRISPVILTIDMRSDRGDIEAIKESLGEKISSYINQIAPGSFLEAGYINALGTAEPFVDYFSVVQIFVDEEEKFDNSIFQLPHQKMILDEILWT